ncbi:MAG: amidohydrolase [Chloroflexota bacterium]|nr:amidohydrolase [Chloroflexota bacterium]
MTLSVRPHTLERLEPDLVRLRRDLHRHPELAFAERRTASIVRERLEALGLVVRSGVGGTGVVADLEGSEPGPRVLVRADMDAIPVTERTGLEYASTTPGVMHACGHDAHVSALIGTATVLTDMRELPGSIRFCFQPGEELLTGARQMISDGVMDGVDAVLGAHLLSPVTFGTISLVDGAFLAGGDLFELRIVGKAGHGGTPQSSIDPVYAAAQVVSALQSVVARETRPGEPLVVSINAIQGGSAANVAVDMVTLRGTIRWFSPLERQRGLARIEAIARGVGEALRVRIEFEVLGGAPVTRNVPEYAALVDEAVTETGRAAAVDTGAITATDDVAHLLDLAPGAFFGVGAGGPDAVPHHHPEFEIDERAIGLMSEVLARAAIKALHHRPGESGPGRPGHSNLALNGW